MAQADNGTGRLFAPDVETLTKEIRTAIWDFDGVVADTEPLQMQSFRTVLHDLGIPLSAEDDFSATYVGMNETAIWKNLTAAHRITEPIDELRSRRATAYFEVNRNLEPAWYVRPLLDRIRGGGGISIIVSSGQYENISRLLTRWSLSADFDAIYCTGSPTDPTFHNKEESLIARLTDSQRPILLLEDLPKYLDLAIHKQGVRTLAIVHELNDINPDLYDATLPINLKNPEIY